MIPKTFNVPPHIQEFLPNPDAGKKKIQFVNPNVKNYEPNIRNAGKLHQAGISMMHPNTEKGVVVVVGSGPSLADPEVQAEIRRYVDEEDATIIATKASIKYMADLGFSVKYGVSMDPGTHIACEEKLPRVKGVTHLTASSSDPSLFEYLKDEQVIIFHSATGYERELELYKELFDQADVMGGGYNVVNRAVACAQFLGFGKIVLAGCDCGWREDQSFYVDGRQNRPGLDMSDKGMVEMTDADGQQLDPVPEGAKMWMTRPDMLASGVALARLAKNFGKDRIVILGDTLPQHLQHKGEPFLTKCADFN